MPRTKTLVNTVQGHVLELNGAVDREEAIDRARRMYEHNLDLAKRQLAALDAGDVRINVWRGTELVADLSQAT